MPGLDNSPGLYVARTPGGPNVGRIVIIELTVVGLNARIGVAALLALALLAAGCGSGQGGDYGGQHPDYDKALAGSPPPLAALYRQGNELLGGGQDAYEKRIAALRGYPVVVNVWASWCGPCRFEFPTLQELSAQYGKRVAFLGVDSQDSEDAAHTFLSEAPLPYPSYTDPDEDIKTSLGAGFGLPDTAFYDRTGELVFLKQGPYSHASELRADIERCSLAGECESG
jgi:cytochrome c biogenesis protein CcmG/thiol:disulfide interchange protein DsbE